MKSEKTIRLCQDWTPAEIKLLDRLRAEKLLKRTAFIKLAVAEMVKRGESND